MRITDLLDKQSISLNGAPKEKKRVQPVSGKVLPFLMVNVMLLQNRGWQLWLSKRVWILIPWMVNRCI